MTARVQASRSPRELAALAAKQCNAIIPDGDDVSADTLMDVLPRALERLENCFQAIDNKYFFDGKAAIFNHLHGDQYCMWLYLLANELHRQGAPRECCSKLFLLNKTLHGCDIFYEVTLPDIFILVHPLGTVLGRANYQDYFVSYQRVSVGSNHDVYPTFGRDVTLRPGAAVLGRSEIGDGTQIAAESLVLDRDVPPSSTYIGGPRDAVVRPNTRPYPLWRQ
jgi:serine O-acetyltransferase